MGTSRNWTAYNRNRRANSGRSGSYRSGDLEALCRRTGTAHTQAKSQNPGCRWNKNATVTTAPTTKRSLTADEREQLKLQLALAEQTNDVARYCNAKAALRAGY